MSHASFLENSIQLFTYYKHLADQSIQTLDPEDWHTEMAPGSNSIFIIMKHLWGNMNSRWRDFLTTDGEKPDRHRDMEFTHEDLTTEQIKERWNSGWKLLFTALETAKTVDEDYVVYIRNEGHSIMEAVQRQLAHYAYHVGQIVYLSKMIQGEDFTSLSVPRGQSQAYNAKKFKQEKTDRFFTERIHDDLGSM